MVPYVEVLWQSKNESGASILVLLDSSVAFSTIDHCTRPHLREASGTGSNGLLALLSSFLCGLC